ncbi:hypothetical protein IscW_ISCW011512 [Ixodes scapularis]|uniref:Uncharacterized protein n=1 Tax=Ixodes scapularis TaxID=6945 RepID=B7Q542_IXOSC|nr:hypothetical protein IscW_ISCW011512 [Ixodes scapularis]|eukprot:XP_002411679.1 hypothetical protein IscW_ISCW011512 [Ixodes scapularis]
MLLISAALPGRPRNLSTGAVTPDIRSISGGPPGLADTFVPVSTRRSRLCCFFLNFKVSSLDVNKICL